MHLIVRHQKAIAFDISTEDCPELACNLVIVGHVVGSPSSGLWVREDDKDEMSFDYDFGNIQDG